LIPKDCKRLAEVDFPIATVSKHAAREKSIRHGHPSTLHLWWARRPLAACRAVLLGLLLPDPCDPHCPKEFKAKATKALLDVPGWATERMKQQVKSVEGLRKALLAFIGDMAGFAAATYMRGLPLVQVPTTLLAMVDSSVGGKTGVDLPAGKNLVGAFKQPSLVVIDPTLLATLPAADFRAGLAEVVKAAVIGSPQLFKKLETGQLDPAWLIREAVAVKVAVVQADPYEQGQRAVLNLGHTFAHAFEALSDYRLRHGEAVAMGMGAAARLAVDLGRCAPGIARRIVALLDHLGLPTAIPGYDPEAVWTAMTSDKKKQGSQVRFVLPLDIGQVDVFDDVPREAVLAVLDLT
jgi:3-dehydroquinate synthetase